MKKGFLKKILAAILLSFTVCGLASCQTADKTATIVVERSAVEIFTKESQPGKKYFRTTVGVTNPTIYNVYGFEVYYQAYNSEGAKIGGEEEVYLQIGVYHGQSGYVYYEGECASNLVSQVKITRAGEATYASLWDSYVVPFVIAIICVAFAILFFAIDLFRKKLTFAEVRELLAAKIASSLIVLLLLAIICIIPLLFSSWVVTLIIVGAYLAFILLALALTGIRSLACKKDDKVING